MAPVDWFIDRSLTTTSRLRGEIRSYLERHGVGSPHDVAVAELAVSELLANAYEHGAGPIWVTLEWGDELPLLTVHDLGPTFEIGTVAAPEQLAERGRGLWLVSQLATELRAASKRAGGNAVSVRLPVPRKPAQSSTPPRPSINPLPAMAEAGPAGFGRESFLRALVVQLAVAVEDRHGPDAAQEVLAQVGTDMGGQMETEYRFAEGAVAERLTTEEIAHCCVRLKNAIGGDFFVIEITEDRVVLGSARCPFGEAVQRSPALCRITSSVFGGIGARNTGSATVQLPERIALGDPGCRIVLHLGKKSGQGGHHYPSAEGAPDAEGPDAECGPPEERGAPVGHAASQDRAGRRMRVD